MIFLLLIYKRKIDFMNYLFADFLIKQLQEVLRDVFEKFISAQIYESLRGKVFHLFFFN